MKSLIKGNIIFEESDISKTRRIIFTSLCRVLSIISSVPSIITIIILLTYSNHSKLQQKIQIMMCISFIGIELAFLFPSSEKKSQDELNLLPRFQSTLAYTFSIITLYWQVSHAFIAYKFFTSPSDLDRKIIKFFIFIFPWLLFFVLAIYSFFISDLIVHFNYIVVPNDIISKIISGFLKVGFFILIILLTIALLQKIKSVLIIDNSSSFTTKKYKVYKKKLLQYIFGNILVYHQFLVRGIINFLVSNSYANKIINSIFFQTYFFGMTTISGLIFWFIYLYNKNLYRRFLIIIHKNTEKDYEKEFEEEKQIDACTLNDDPNYLIQSKERFSLTELPFDVTVLSLNENFNTPNQAEENKKYDDEEF